MKQDFGLLFHRLNNQLGIILANAELLEGDVLELVRGAHACRRLGIGGHALDAS